MKDELELIRGLGSPKRLDDATRIEPGDDIGLIGLLVMGGVAVLYLIVMVL